MSLTAAIHLMTLYGCASGDSQGVSGTAAETSVAGTVQPAKTTSALAAQELSVAAGAAYELAGGNASKNGEEVLSEKDGQSGIKVSTGGKLTASGLKVVTKGKTPSETLSLKSGLNAGVLVEASSALELSGSEVLTSGVGAGGVFATGTNAAVTLSNVKISTAGTAAPGLSVSANASGMVTSAEVSAEGDRSPALFIGAGGGTLSLLSGSLSAAGADSPGVRSLGTVNLTGTTVRSAKAEAAVLNGNSTVTFTGVKAYAGGENGVRFIRDGDAGRGSATFNMVAGTLDSLSGALFYVEGASAAINLNSVTLVNASDTLLTAEAGGNGEAASDSSGSTAEKTGANATLTMDHITAAGDVECDMFSTVTLNLKNGTTYTGAVNNLCSGKEVTVVMDAGSKWVLTGDSYVTVLTNALMQLTNIRDGGFHIYYDSSNPANSWLEGKTVALSGGGSITPDLSRGELT